MVSEELLTPELGHYDVIVCGGGVGGIASAVAASRQGAKVMLIEKTVLLGGLATAGLISWFEPLCDGKGKKLMYGIVDELFDLSIKYGDDTFPENWKNKEENSIDSRRYASFFSPTIFSIALDEYLEKANVTILLDTVVVRPLMENNHCNGVVVENKTGRGYYSADFIIDGTGDADIMFRAGVPCENGKNYLTYIAYIADKNTCAQARETNHILDSRKWTASGSDLWGKGHPEGEPRLSGTTAEEVTEYVLKGRKLLFEKLLGQDPKTRDVTVLPSMAQFRTTRRIVGGYTLTENDVGKHFPSSISTAGDFANRGHCYELPFEILCHPDFDNLLTVGRTVSSAGWAWEVTRVIPIAIATGQAAGTAAALCSAKGCTLKELEIAELRCTLENNGVRTRLNESED